MKSHFSALLIARSARLVERWSLSILSLSISNTYNVESVMDNRAMGKYFVIIQSKQHHNSAVILIQCGSVSGQVGSMIVEVSGGYGVARRVRVRREAQRLLRCPRVLPGLMDSWPSRIFCVPSC